MHTTGLTFVTNNCFTTPKAFKRYLLFIGYFIIHVVLFQKAKQMLGSQNELSSQNGQIIMTLSKITDERLSFKHSPGYLEFV